MITVYDMTSGTFRKELEISNTPEEPTQPAMVELAGIDKELQLREVEFKRTEVVGSMPAHMVNVKIGSFINTMK
ncbi:MAG TPA: hypothetical protein ENI65_03660 [Gammaproteobacteria bacterium]|nr:hypothetical protein [Gammaproteobacteria bacterium]